MALDPRQGSLDLQAVRDGAIQLAADHADAVTPLWSDRAFNHVRAFVRRADEPFMAERVRAEAERDGLPQPPDPRAWGAVMQRAARAGLIEAAGFAESQNVQAHLRPTRLWRRCPKVAGFEPIGDVLARILPSVLAGEPVQ